MIFKNKRNYQTLEIRIFKAFIFTHSEIATVSALLHSSVPLNEVAHGHTKRVSCKVAATLQPDLLDA